MATLTSLCVYCGSRDGNDAGFAALARALGTACAARSVGIVFGGGHIGLMGELAGAALAAGGHVVGVIPEHLQRREVAFEAVSELLVVDSMHTRKRLMAERADAFCVLPGGLGTLDEAVEIITWKQLRLHDKPIVLLDHAGYWQPLLRLFAHQQAAGFVDPDSFELFDVAADPDSLFAAVDRHPEPTLSPVPARF